jgi:hypothetical protein
MIKFSLFYMRMPVARGTDAKGSFYRFGSSGTKYYYKSGDVGSRKRARALAERQGRAIRASGWKGK